MPCFVLLKLLALHEAGNTEVDLVAFFVSALDPDTVGNVDMTWYYQLWLYEIDGRFKLTGIAGVFDARLSSYIVS